MLAQNFKTPADLKIAEPEFEALVKTLGILERGEVRHVPLPQDKDCFTTSHPAKFTGLFNMDEIYTQADCGTAACIAGTCDWLFKTKFAGSWGVVREDLPSDLQQLFAPDDVPFDLWKEITVEQAATALRNYLTTGKPNWAEALAE